MTISATASPRSMHSKAVCTCSRANINKTDFLFWNVQARNQDFLWGGSFKWSLGPNTCRGSGGVTPGKFLKNEYPFWCILSHFHKPLPDFFLKLTSILMHFEVFWQVTPGKFLTNGYPLWCILRYFFRRQPWNFFLHLHPFWCILKYFRTSSLENFWKTDIHFGAFWAIFTSHSRIFF